MKKIYILAVAAIFSTASFAQVSEQGNANADNSKAITKSLASTKTPTDTCGWVPNASKWLPGEFAVGGQVWNYGYTGGGYVYGVNISTNEINHVAQGYMNINSASIGIEGVLVGFVGKMIGVGGTGAASMDIHVYEMSANQAMSYDGTNWNQDAIGPNASPKGSTTLSFANADTNWFSLSYAAFSTVVGTSTDFAVSVDATAIKAANDTVGLASDTDGEGYRLAFHYIPAQSAFYITDDLFGGLNNNIAIFAVIDDNYVGVEDHDFLNNMQLSAYPNPAKDQTTISYNLKEDMDNVTLVVYDMAGKEVYRAANGSQAKGSYNVSLDVSEYNAGNYFYSLVGNGNRLTKRMVVVK
jgi:hypothetical protein